jgi:hypothetical protein
MALVVRSPYCGRNKFIIVRSLFEYSKLRMFDEQIISGGNDLYSFIDKETPSNEKAMDCDFSWTDR